MKQNHFVYNDKTYFSGTIIKIKQFDYVSRKNTETYATFCHYDTENKLYVCKVYNCMISYTHSIFNNSIICVTDMVDDKFLEYKIKCKKLKEQQNTFANELKRDDLLIAWIWYIFIMMIAIIFKDRIGIWIFASIIFFNYRKRKLKGG